MKARALTACTLLLVDDEPVNLDFLEAILIPEGFENVVRVTDAREAVSLADRVLPDIVLLDLHMPYKSGFEVLVEIRARTRPDEYLPILVLTADVSPEAKERALSGGANDFLTKPLDATEVLLRVRNLLETRLLYDEQRLARREAEASSRRAALLAEASRILASSLDLSTTMAQLARTLAPGFADVCAVHTLEGDSWRLAGSATDPSIESTALFAPGSASAEGSGETLPGLSGAVMRVPLRATGEQLGMLTLARVRHGAAFHDAERDVAVELGVRAALAVENARLIASAQRAANARDQVLSVVAHDLRNPLAAIAGYAETLRQLLPPHREMRQRQMLTRIEEIAQRTHALVEDLLEVSRLERGYMAIRPRAISPKALLHEAASMLAPLAARCTVDLVFQRPGELPSVDADATRVLQVFSNLVGNALKFTPAGGRVTVTCAVEGEEFVVAVSDTGPGVPADQVPHIFLAFWKGDSSYRRSTGLGLVISRAIIESHGGRIWLDPVVDAGTTFRFTLPLSASAVRDGARQPLTTAEWREETT